MTTEIPQRLRFLSDEWRTAVRELVAGVAGTELDEPGLVVNATIHGVPFGDGPLEVHSAHGPVVGWEDGLVDDADFSLEADYHIVKALVIDPSATSDALSQALDVGAVKVEGDRAAFGRWWRRRIGKTTAVELEQRIRDITA